MSQQVPFDNNSVPPENGIVSAGGYTDAAFGSVPHASGGGSDPYGADGGYWQPPQGPQRPSTYARHRAPMIDPIESTKLTPQIMILLVISGLKRHWKWCLPTGLVLGLLTAGALYVIFPLQYGSRALIRIRTTKPTFVFDEHQSGGRYDDFVNTQFAYMRSALVLDRALDDQAVARLPIILKQRDKRAWLTKKLSIKSDGKSEIVAVSIETDAEEASEKIVNAVVDAYFTFIDDQARKNENDLLVGFTAERQKQQSQATELQDRIRNKTREAAKQGGVAGAEGVIGTGLSQGESLVRDVAIAQSQLTAMQAKLKAVQQRIAEPSTIPPEVLIQMHPDLFALNGQREALQQRKEQLIQAFPNPSDQRILLVDQQISVVDERIKKILGNTEEGGLSSMQNALRLQDMVTKYNLEQDIRAQDLLVQELTNKYNEQLARSAVRTENMVDVSFDIASLRRADKILDAIDDRAFVVRSEQRAPDQITLLSRAVNSKPNWIKQIAIVGMGGCLFLSIPLLLSIAVERMKPRLYHVSQVRRAVPQVLIGEIMEPPVSWVHGTTFRKRLARYRESVHNWCTHLLLSDPFRSCRTLSIASVAGDDGKTFLAVQIAVAMAQMKSGNVLLIDGDMRVGRLHLLFGNEEAGIGLADVLAFRNGFGEAMVQNEKEPNLHLLSAGQLDVTPYELLGDGRFRELLDMLEQNYSLILVVLPPVANAAESLIMAASTDSTLLCVRQGETVLAAMEDIYRKLVNTGASVDSIVVKDIPYYQMAGRDGGFADRLEQIRLSHLLQYAD